MSYLKMLPIFLVLLFISCGKNKSLPPSSSANEIENNKKAKIHERDGVLTFEDGFEYNRLDHNGLHPQIIHQILFKENLSLFSLNDFKSIKKIKFNNQYIDDCANDSKTVDVFIDLHHKLDENSFSDWLRTIVAKEIPVEIGQNYGLPFDISPAFKGIQHLDAHNLNMDKIILTIQYITSGNAMRCRVEIPLIISEIQEILN